LSLLLPSLLLCLTAAAFWLGRNRAVAVAGGALWQLHSLPAYHGSWVALCCALPALAVLVVWLVVGPWLLDGLVVSSLPDAVRALPNEGIGMLLADARVVAAGGIPLREPSPEVLEAAHQLGRLRWTANAAVGALLLAAATAGLVWGRGRIRRDFRARIRVERAVKVALVVSSTVAILTTIGIVLSLIFESLRFFALVSPTEFLFGLEWSPQTAIRADQVGSSGAFGAVPVFAGTLLITLIAMAVAAPVGLMSAIYLSEYAGATARAAIKPTLEILAGIPTVVYGFFAALTIAPFVRGLGGTLGLDVASESALAAGLVMGVMIIPFVSSLSDDVVSAVPQALREGSLGLGATKSETIKRVVLPAALPGIVGALLLAVSRAIGETMIVVMAAGLAANLTVNPLEAVTTVTVQIVTLLVGDQEFDSAKTLAAFALGLLLFVVTLLLNVIALTVVRRFREKYD
jgi:phosphate transport system permease protein